MFELNRRDIYGLPLCVIMYTTYIFQKMVGYFGSLCITQVLQRVKLRPQQFALWF